MAYGQVSATVISHGELTMMTTSIMLLFLKHNSLASVLQARTGGMLGMYTTHMKPSNFVFSCNHLPVGMLTHMVVVQMISEPPQQDVKAWVLAFQAQVQKAPDTGSALAKAALAACLQLPPRSSAAIIEGLADAASQSKPGEHCADKSVLQSTVVV